MELVIERVVALVLLMAGLSYIFQGPLWVALLQEVLEKPSLLMIWSLFFLPFGLLVIMGHNLWVADWRTSVTLVGWLVTLKCVLYLLFPGWIGFAQKWSDAFIQLCITVAGGALATVGALLTFLSFLGQ